MKLITKKQKASRAKKEISKAGITWTNYFDLLLQIGKHSPVVDNNIRLICDYLLHG